jgi:hypothetical protein
MSNFSLGTSVVTIILPASEPNQTLTIVSDNAGLWSDENKSYDIGGKDYHGIVSIGQNNINYTAAKVYCYLSLA